MEPLASKIRPKKLSEFVGQEHLVGKNKPLYIAINQKNLFSFILWGPPGVGKTTLARMYARSLNADYHELSAVSAGKDDIRQIIDTGIKGTGELLGPKILFLDEIHRFNKAQQDFLLPHVESGRLTLIGATTENPSFEVIPALLSRCRVFVMEELKESEIKKIIKNTGYKLKKDEIDFLVSIANGDARQVLTIIENTISLYKEINIENLKNTLQTKFLRYDKKGDEHYNTVSAFIKSMRASNTDAALYYMNRMLEAGEDPKFIARRMVIFASEDIGISLPTALVVANAVFQAVTTIGMPECAINLAHGVVYLSQAPKDRRVYDAHLQAQDDVRKHGNLPIPFIIRNPTTKLNKELGYGKDYEAYTNKDLMPEKLKNKKYLEKKR
jgi:putative ATPase